MRKLHVGPTETNTASLVYSNCHPSLSSSHRAKKSRQQRHSSPGPPGISSTFQDTGMWGGADGDSWDKPPLGSHRGADGSLHHKSQTILTDSKTNQKITSPKSKSSTNLLLTVRNKGQCLLDTQTETDAVSTLNKDSETDQTRRPPPPVDHLLGSNTPSYIPTGTSPCWLSVPV